jgi:hypothetical protein
MAHRAEDLPLPLLGSRIEFSTRSGTGTVDHAGTIGNGDEELHLHTRGQINGHEAYAVYRFTRVPGIQGG